MHNIQRLKNFISVFVFLFFDGFEYLGGAAPPKVVPQGQLIVGAPLVPQQ